MSFSYPKTLPKFNYIDAKTVQEACSLLVKHKGNAKVIAGGTDLMPAMRYRRIVPQHVINIKSISNLDCIHYDDEKGLIIGALTTLDEIDCSPVIREKFPAIANSAHLVGHPQIRNWGTIAGNLCNAAPSADTAPPLIALGAKVRIQGVQDERVTFLEDFFSGPGQTVLQVGEILTEILVPNLPPNTRSVYLKLPAKRAVGIAVVGVAVAATLDDKNAHVIDVKIALGAVAPTPIRARKAEAVLKGKALTKDFIEKAAQEAANESKPISDVRGSSNYRKQMVKIMTKQALKKISGTA
jgi:carbon-monoxide dehydrogenase medium subunit